jgi:hypothetical protein
MGKARIQKQHVKLFLLSQDLFLPVKATIDFSKGIFLGEVDSFKATSRTKVVISRPAGYINEGATHDYGGWDLSFDGGKVDWELANFYWLQDQTLRAGGQPPAFLFMEEIWHYNGAYEQWWYKDCSLFGFDGSRGDDNTESIKGFSPIKTLGIKDNTILKDPIGTALRQSMFKAAFSKNNDIRNIERPF